MISSKKLFLFLMVETMNLSRLKMRNPHIIPKKIAVYSVSKTVNSAYDAAIVAITAVKKTVAPIPAYFVRSPGAHSSSISVSAPEQKIKNRCSIVVGFGD